MTENGMNRLSTIGMLAAAVVCCFWMTSCSEGPPEPEPVPVSRAPVVSADQPALVYEDSVIVRGTVNPNGLAASYYFMYDTTTALRFGTLSQDLGSGTEPITVQATLSRVWTGSVHHWRLFARNGGGSSWADGHDFVFRPWPPTVEKCEGVSTEVGTAMLSGRINPNGTTTAFHFEYDTTTQYRWRTADQSAGSGTSPVDVQTTVTNLFHGKTYYNRLIAMNVRGSTTKEGTAFRAYGDSIPRELVFSLAVGNTWTYRYNDNNTNTGGAYGIHTWMCMGQEAGGWRILVARKDSLYGFGPQYPAFINDSLSFLITVDANTIHVPFPEWMGWFEASIRVPRLFWNDTDTLRILSNNGPFLQYETVEYESGVGLRLYHAQDPGITSSIERKLTLLTYHRE